MAIFIGNNYLGVALRLRFVCGRSRYVHALPKRAHRWHKFSAFGVHFALAVVQATHALLLIADIESVINNYVSKSPSVAGEVTDRSMRRTRLQGRRLSNADGPGRTDRPVGSQFVIPRSI